MIPRLLISAALGLVTSYCVAVIPPNLPGQPYWNSVRPRSADPFTDDQDGLVPVCWQSRWRDVYQKSFYDDPGRGLVAAVPSPNAFRRQVRARNYQDFILGRCGTGMPRTCSVEVEEWGWPMRSAWCWRTYDEDTGAARGGGFTANRPAAAPRSPWDPPDITLPYGILGPGLALNTALFGIPWLALLITPVALRSLRRKRGHCVRCGYDLQGLPLGPCPECGTQPSA